MVACCIRRLLHPAAVGMSLWLVPFSAAAATFSVTNSGDAGDASPGNGVCATSGGVCTLRAAVQEANALAGADTINVSALTIVLGSTLSVTQSVTLNGSGQGVTFLDGNNAVQVLNFAVGSGTHTLSNLTIRNANTTANGGAVFNEATLSVINVTLSANRARQGGGIFSQFAFGSNVPNLTLTNVLFSGNVGTSTVFGEGGGGLFNGSRLTATNVTLSSNTAQQGGGYYNNSFQSATLSNFSISGNTAKYGAGIDNDLGNITLNGGTLSSNVSQCCDGANSTGGGAIYNNEGAMTLTDVTLSGNQATSPGGYGGAIYNYQSMTLTRVSLVGNRAAYGAAIYNGNFTGVANSLSLTNVTISANVGVSSVSPVVDAVGAGLYNTSNGQVVVANSTIAFNTAVVGGGIENLPSGTNNNVSLRNSILSNNVGTIGSPNCRGTIGSGGSNLVSSSSGCNFILAAGDQVGADPRLLALRGSPAFHPLRLDSPAFQTGNNSLCPSTDQRGLARPQGGVCDKGAYEIGDVPVMGDWDGNGTKTVGIYRPWERVWYLRNSNSSGVNDIPAVLYGAPGDMPVVGDWNGDGVDTVGIYRPSEHVWYLRNSNTSGVNDIPAILYGTDADLPVAGDWNGDGTTTIGVYRPAEHVWYLRDLNSTGNNTIPAVLYGTDGDLPVVGNWDGLGNTDTVGVFRPSERIWYLRDANTTGNNTIPAVFYGDASDDPVPGDYDGNGTSTVGVYRLRERAWYLRNSNTSGVNTIPVILF